MSALYAAYSQGEQSPLAELPIQYADFSVWQRQWLQGEVLDKQLAYWKQQLEGAPAVLELRYTTIPVKQFRHFAGQDYLCAE